ncbi:MAG: PAS domain S-box protein [Gammaproteobacteria bacterium]|nr:PAS domain S-box protein [Gammaproteobacteria bacterium]
MMRLSIVHKISLGAIFLVLLSAGMVGGLFYSKTTELLVQETLQGISKEIHTVSSRLLAHIEAQQEDVIFLANTPPVQGMLRALKNSNYDRLGKSTYQQWVVRQQSIFKTLLASKPNYLKLRLIDKHGQERVVVGRDGDKVEIIRSDLLQNKAPRLYFKKALVLSAGQVYLSEINLNKEYGKVSLPHSEVLRTSTPIYDESSGEFAGVLLITAEIGNHLRKLEANFQDANRNIYITNDHGGYLLHHDASKTYGFDLGKRYRIQEDIPQIAHMFLPDNKQNDFVLLPTDTNDKKVVNFTKLAFDSNQPERFIAVGIVQNYSAILAQQAGVLNDVMLLALLLVVVLTLLGVAYANRLSAPLKQLTQIMGDYSHQRTSKVDMPVNRKDEIGVLVKTYQQLMAQVEEYQQNLEVKISERTHELKASEIRQRTVLETVADAIITIDRNGVITGFNPAAENIFGYTLEEARGQNVSFLMQQSERQEHEIRVNNSRLDMSRLIKEGKSLRGLRKNGAHFPVEINVAPMAIDGEQGFVGILRDISERVMAEQELNRFKTTLDETLDCVFMFEPDSLMFFYVNAGALSQVGYTEAELMQMKAFDIKPEISEQQFRQMVEPMIAGQQSVLSFETVHQHKDGHTIPVEIFLQYINPPGELPRFVAIVRDITERLKTDKMKNEFISTVSHELRTPLTSIRASLGLISQGIVGEIPAEAQEMLKIAGNNTERLLLLINDILDIQKIESGQMSFKFQSLSVMPFLQQAILDNAGYGEEHGVSFVIANEIPDSTVYADKDRLMQVMANLMSNAAKFSPQGETVEISVARHAEDSLRISVTDHGPGIPEEFIPKLFEKFTQSDSSDSRQKGGTGLGLSITKVIVEKHGGQIDFITRQGVGSTFYIELPELIGEMTEQDDSPRILLGQHQPCILIVEDDPDVAALLKRMLAEAGFNCDIAYNIEVAREKLEQQPAQYKAITLDLLLAGENGLDLLDDLHDVARGFKIPVVVISVKANETKRDLHGGALGVVEWLQKPIDQQHLIDAVKQAAGSFDMPRVLHVEDETDVHSVVSKMLRNHCELTWTSTKAASIEALEQEKFDLVLLDIGLPDGSGLDLLELIEQLAIPPRVVIFSAYDVGDEYADKVSAVLVKSRTNNSRLAEVINDLIRPQCGQ